MSEIKKKNLKKNYFKKYITTQSQIHNYIVHSIAIQKKIGLSAFFL